MLKVNIVFCVIASILLLVAFSTFTLSKTEQSDDTKFTHAYHFCTSDTMPRGVCDALNTDPSKSGSISCTVSHDGALLDGKCYMNNNNAECCVNDTRSGKPKCNLLGGG